MGYKIESRSCAECGKKVYADEFGEFTFVVGKNIYCSSACKDMFSNIVKKENEED